MVENLFHVERMMEYLKNISLGSLEKMEHPLISLAVLDNNNLIQFISEALVSFISYKGSNATVACIG